MIAGKIYIFYIFLFYQLLVLEQSLCASLGNCIKHSEGLVSLC